MTGNTIHTISRMVRHVTIDTGRPYAAFRADYETAVPAFDRLEAIGVVTSGAGWAAIRTLSGATATHGFVNFFVFDPSPVMAVNGNTRRAVTYLTGNIIMAERGFRRDPSSFLYLPLRVVIAEGPDGNARLSLDLPADLFAAFADPALGEVGADFGRTFAALLEHLNLPVPEGLAATDHVHGSSE